MEFYTGTGANMKQIRKRLRLFASLNTLTILFEATALILIGCAVGFAGDIYIAQSPAGSASGTSCSNAYAYTWFNATANWANPKVSGKIGPGDTVHLCGAITSPLTVQKSGSSGKSITILFEPGANMTSPAWPLSGAIVVYGKNYITIDGGATGVIGGPNGSASYVNGIIQNTANGTGLANQVNSHGIVGTGATYFTVKNLAIYNMYVRAGVSDENPYGVGVSDTAGVNNYLVTNCIIHDAATGIDSDFGGGGNTYEFSFNTIYNVNWGGRSGDRGSTSTLSGLLFHDNLLYGFEARDDTRNEFHHNGFYVYAANGGTIYGVSEYNNVIGSPGVSYSNVALLGFNDCTSGFFLSGNVVGPILIYNNLFLNTGAYGPANALAVLATTSSSASTWGVYNNTFVGGNGSQSFGVACRGTGTCTATFENNLFYTATGRGDTAISEVYNSGLTMTSSYNLGYGLPADPFKWGNGNPISLAAWQAATGQDSNWNSGNPHLTGRYTLGAGSAAIGSGANLSSYFTTDNAGSSRPASGPWDIGAYESGGLRPPNNLRIELSD